MFCNNCGKNLPDEAKFCDGCGQKLSDNSSEPVNSQPSAPSAPPPSPPPPQSPAKSAYSSPSYNSNGLVKPMSVGQYIVTFIVIAIPLLNIIMLLVWSFGSGTNINRRNMCRAMLIMMLIGIVLAIFSSAALTALFQQLFNNGGMIYY